MNADLEKQLKEMGPDYRAVVDRLRAARAVEPESAPAVARPMTWRRTATWLVAASTVLVVGLTVHLTTRTSTSQIPQPLSYGAREYHLSVAEIMATQRVDGSWQNDFLTRRNAEVLSRCKGAEEHIAYKKAMRNLRSRGIL